MSRVLLIGAHEEFQRAPQASPALDGCEVLTAAGNVGEVCRVRARAFGGAVRPPPRAE